MQSLVTMRSSYKMASGCIWMKRRSHHRARRAVGWPLAVPGPRKKLERAPHCVLKRSPKSREGHLRTLSHRPVPPAHLDPLHVLQDVVGLPSQLEFPNLRPLLPVLRPSPPRIPASSPTSVEVEFLVGRLFRWLWSSALTISPVTISLLL